ncbi:MAG: 4Fe-4S dicluster domain-containing protein [Peptococcaceae bacterium]|jgi:Fe-S-cluster-containing hydrogenase component 2|nr:4Fe-4S dicluster domain-containing protein [Peptococcaceae bacterium]MDH7525035.1 4Fe-4S dicluster domain-containing protein [Peptococcaceae bacterium]
MKKLNVKENLCIGCRQCELACSLYNEGQFNPSLARIRVIYDQKTNTYSPNTCRNCSRPKCLEACAAGALAFNRETGVVVYDRDKCARCYECVKACPFKAIYIAEKGYILKCDLCGGNPVCVRLCSPRPEKSSPLMNNQEGEQALNYY